MTAILMETLPYSMPGIDARFMTPETVNHLPEDPRAWVPRPGGGEFLPCMFDTCSGTMANVYRYTKAGGIGRHLHSSPVYAYTLEGSWGYYEHDWTAKKGTFVFEAPGEVHTLVVHEAPMTAFFVWMGGMQALDENDNVIAATNVHTLITACNKHYCEVGLGPDYIKQFVRG